MSLLKAIPFSRNHSFQRKPFFPVETITFSGSHRFKLESFILMETIPLSKSQDLLVVAILFRDLCEILFLTLSEFKQIS